MQEAKDRRSNRERTEATRAALIAAARRLFVERGYAETGTPEIVAAASVTRGALYHHFADKQALFRAVVEEEARIVAAEIESATPEGLASREAIIRGGDVYLAAMTEPGRTQLLLIDGPAVLGRAEMDEIDGRHAAHALRMGLEQSVSSGDLPAGVPVEAATELLSAAFDRAALSVAAGKPREPYRKVLRALFDGLATLS